MTARGSGSGSSSSSSISRGAGLGLLLALSNYVNSTQAGMFPSRDAAAAEYVAAPYYPAPYGGWVPEWKASYAKAKTLVETLTLAEKTNITAGTGMFMGDRCNGNTGSAARVGFPQLCLCDSALGVGATDHNTAFPAGITTGATFDKKLMYKRGVAIGQEFRGKGVNVYLGPTVGPMGRKPLGGRGWEGFGTDPVLQAVGGAQTIRGVQEQGVIATIKHLVGNEQEKYRKYHLWQPAYSANMDDRTLHELYLWPFAAGVHEGVGAVMTAYNAVNGSACSQNSYLINSLLKDELGFQGFVMTDWLAQISGVASALAGLDMAMPGDTLVPLLGHSYWMYELSRSVLNGTVPIDRLNDMVTRVVATWYQLGQDQSYPEPNFSVYTNDEIGLLYPGAVLSPMGRVNEFVDVQSDHAVVARQVAQDAVTLLKNEGGVLPLAPSTRLFVFGTDAQANPAGPNACPYRSCNSGTLGMGWGSGGSTKYPYFDDPITAIKKRSPSVVYYATDFFPPVDTPAAGDVAVVFVSSDSGENSFTVEGNHGDRDSSQFAAWHNGDALVQATAEKYSSVVVVVHTVGPLLVEQWVDLPSVQAVLFAHLPGQEAGESLANILYGHVSPSGHLPYTVPRQVSDLPDSVTTLTGFALGQPQDTYSEGLYIDYRYLNRHGIKPRFAFGQGLSYTTFSFTDATITAVTPLTPVPPARPAKDAPPFYPAAMPSASEAVSPSGFAHVWRYLYSWLSEGDAEAAAAVGVGVAGASSKTYPYPDGYSTEQKPDPPAGGAQGGNPALWDVAYTIRVKVTNTGAQHAGKASVQAYVQHPEGSGYDTPVIQLRDFEKTGELAPGASEVIELSLTRKDLSVWDVVQQNWVVPGGSFKVWLGEGSHVLGLACETSVLTCAGGLEGPV